MADVSDARQALRDYARRPINLVEMDEENQRLNVTTGKLGEVAGLTFEALQGVLEIAERGVGRLVSADDVLRAIERPFTR
jgi:hypothetical protein